MSDIRDAIDAIETRYADDAAARDRALAELGAAIGVPYFDERQLQLAITSYDQVSFAECDRRGMLQLAYEGDVLWLLADPFDERLMSALAVRFRTPHRFAFTRALAITARLRRDETSIRAVDSVVDSGPGGQATDSPSLTLTSIAEDHSPVVRIVNASLYDAWRIGASDIHYETTLHGLQIKCRLDGVLSILQQSSGPELAEQIVSRLKVMAELDIAERRVPQDGRFQLSLNGRSVDFRVSVMPSAIGEDVVVRVLDKKNLAGGQAITLDSLGFAPDDQTLIRQLAWEPHGMLLVTGPTGSGKTTTLYAVVDFLHTGEDKIITIEDPVEYNLPGILQIPVNDKKGLTFARGLRSILRHDPDKILIGEIRDNETAQIAIQSALTGHLVLTTVHANNTFDVIGRFTHMGVDPYHFVAALNGVVAQRLIRKNCPHCIGPDRDPEGWLPQLPEAAQMTAPLQKGQGCSHCRGTGYLGRTVIVEILPLDDGLRELIVRRAPLVELRRHALAAGFKTLRSRALDLVRSGGTSLHELVRVVGLRGQ
ncbi:MAG: GspE/PulE family protein [Burkholderiaceae bacterium]|jgi:general secretion pathway protein E